MVTIKSNNGISANVFYEDGSEIKCITGIDISMRPDCIAEATIRLFVSEMTIKAEPILSLKTVAEAANHYGFKLVRA